MNIIYSIASVAFICMLLLLSDKAIAQGRHSYVGDSKGETYRERLIDYADIYSYEVNERTKDTILYIRKVNDYWYGIFGSVNFNLSFGRFNTLYDPNNPKNIYDRIIDFAGKTGAGYTFGLVGEWVRPTSDLSFGLKLGAFDKKISSVDAENTMIITSDSTYIGDHNFKASFTYFTLNPYAKYMFPKLDGLFVTAGVDLSIAYSTVASYERKYQSTGDIKHDMKNEDISGNTRFLLNLGIGYDFFIADFFSANNRVRITPFLDFKGGTNIITSRGSNWNDLAVNVGLLIKLAPDKIKIDTLYYDPNSEIPIDYAVNIVNEEGINFPGFANLYVPPSFNMEVVSIIEPEPEIEPQVDIDIGTQPQPISSPLQNLAIGHNMDLKGFTTSSSTTLSKGHRDSLDYLADFLKANPNAVVRIIGHSDDRGSYIQNTDRATNRATAVVNYLRGKGIARSRLLDRGVGSIEPISNNNTETGRRQNRRVSITIERSN